MNVALDIIIPVYNEGANIVRVLRTLKEKVRTPFRVLICYDFDEDTTLSAIRSADNLGVEVSFVRNHERGPHGAVRAGFEASTAPAVLVFPADDDYNAGMLDQMVNKAQSGCDVVCASRFMKGGSMQGCPWLKALLVRSSAFVLHYVARVPTHDASNGFRLFSQRVIRTLPIESRVGFTYSIELLVKAHRLGLKICEVPAQWFERAPGQGKSNFKVVRWLPAYLRWFFYAFQTTYLRRGPQS
jgi:dolichol-phosphate mannosyltransferase